MTALAIEIGDFLRAMTALQARPSIYPGYLAQRIKTAMRDPANDPEGVFTAVSDIETVGDCRYAMTVTDFNGTRYRVTVVPVVEHQQPQASDLDGDHASEVRA